MNKKTALVLLSGGLDSYVALDIAHKEYEIKLALTFDYGQKAFKEEEIAAKKIANIYNIEQKTIELSFLRDITKNALTDDKNENLYDLKSVWVPNRNGLFLNISASFCESYNIDYIVFGANKEESGKFSDNRKQYIDIMNNSFEYSTMSHPSIYAPCAELDKVDLVNYVIDNNLYLNLIKSCYRNEKELGKKHCNQCMSCKLLYNAILKSKKPELIKEIF